MEVILVAPVRKLGNIADIIKVKNGFGRNYLLPKKLAIRATEFNKKLIEEQKHNFEVKDQQVVSEAKIIGDIINGKELIFIKQAADDGRLFGSVNNKEIAENLSEISSYPISYLNIILNKPIKSTGVFTVEVRLHAQLSANVTVIVAKSELEAQDYSSKNHDQQNNIVEVTGGIGES